MNQIIKRPNGVMLLGSIQVLVAVRGVWNLFYHGDANWELPTILYFILTIFCGAIGYGFFNLKRWAYHSFVIVYLIYIVGYIGNIILGTFPPDLSLSKYRIENIKGAIICTALLCWAYCYRRYFRRPA